MLEVNLPAVAGHNDHVVLRLFKVDSEFEAAGAVVVLGRKHPQPVQVITRKTKLFGKLALRNLVGLAVKDPVKVNAPVGKGRVGKVQRDVRTVKDRDDPDGPRLLVRHKLDRRAAVPLVQVVQVALVEERPVKASVGLGVVAAPAQRSLVLLGVRGLVVHNVALELGKRFGKAEKLRVE